MKTKKPKNPTRKRNRIIFRVSNLELHDLLKASLASTGGNISKYIRKKLFTK